MESKDKLYSVLNLMRRMHPSKINQNVQALVNLAPDLEEEILQRVDQPLGINSSIIKENIKIFKTFRIAKGRLQWKIFH